MWNSEILTADEVQRLKLHHCAKFHRIRSNGCGDIVIITFFKMAATNEQHLVVFIDVQNLVRID